jgi:exodeoxyribonuclease VII large subunit
VKSNPPSSRPRSAASSSVEDLPLFGSPVQKSARLPATEPLPEAPAAGPAAVVEPPQHWTVSELTQKIRTVLEPSFQNVWVKGEISNARPAASGHVYFSLKDQGASISAAIFGWGARGKKPGFELRDGLEVLCRGKLSVYPPRGGYQIIVEQIEPLGAGALQLAFEQLKQKLSAEGLFDPARKRPIPAYPKKIAVITSPSGAAIRDMLIVLKRRAPQIEVLVVPALVQGEDAPKQLIRGIQAVNRYQLADLIVLARGGGSIEDLWCFNDESLARAIAQSPLPVINAVGHEIDFTIADFVADRRAPTPSAAAEIVSQGWFESREGLKALWQRMVLWVRRDIQTRRRFVEQVAARVVSPRDRLREQAQRCDDLRARLDRAMEVRLQQRRSQLESLMGRMDALSPLRVLQRGYSLATLRGQVLKSMSQVAVGDELEVRLSDGVVRSKVIS